jgi:signal transduction histidine kinase
LQLQRFTADAAHELRTPLAALRTIGEVALEKGQNSQEYEEALASILEETARVDETINSLFLLAKAEASQPGNHATVFRAKDLVDEILDLLQIVIEEKQVTVLQENKDDGDAQIKADRSLLRIAILNVLHNALKFAPDSSVLRIEYSLSQHPVPMLEIVFQDEGPGISAGEHEQVFERFFTSSTHITASKSGTGLGLSIARLVISRMSGTIRFDQERQTGAKCIIDLPIYR